MDQPLEHPVDHRLLSREEGQRLLYRAAIDVARRKGALKEGQTPDQTASRMTTASYTLVDGDGKVLARVPLEEARRRLKQRVRIARRVLKGPLAKLPAVARTVRGFSVNQLRLLDEGPRALAWAIGSAEPFPDAGSRLEHQLIAVGLLCLCVLPGLWYVSYRHKRWREYEQEVRSLVARWRSKGRPDPPDSFFLMYES
ncbi:hypothetical protein [Cyanobium sp. CH-040]|uniref:hypothetical protein n=1 Tax=Cyanobium sp. CH-040 TaxID=2823708 RepID=UPI0020CD4F97|nr:hypothetical protein [Cyanobium sp. CH-040]MCP9926339.1 hypothetical protein [Cyanobium sp. CH-040]